MLELKNVDVFYNHIQILWNISIHVNEGEFVSILGPNGAGKSTLLKTILGLCKPSKGEILYMGERIDMLSPEQITRKGICYIPERGRIFSNLTVLENLKLGALYSEVKNLENDNLKKVFDLFPILKERMRQLAGTLSGGERQMLTIARGLMANPKVMLIDEPLMGLAPKVVIKLTDVLKEINKQGTTVILVEQHVKQALDLSERCFVIEGGRIVLEGLSKELSADKHIKEAYLGI
jgi:branched-chain amino acid transport system ATP-binding protein